MPETYNKGSTPNDALSADADRVIPRHTVNGKNAATGESSTLINELKPDEDSPHSGKPNRDAGFNPNDAGGKGTGEETADNTPYTNTKPAEVASESHTLPGPSSTGKNQGAKTTVATQ